MKLLTCENSRPSCFPDRGKEGSEGGRLFSQAMKLRFVDRRVNCWAIRYNSSVINLKLFIVYGPSLFYC